MKVVWAPLAIDRVAEIASYIAEDSPPAADKWIHRAFARVGQLAGFPESGAIFLRPRAQTSESCSGGTIGSSTASNRAKCAF